MDLPHQQNYGGEQLSDGDREHSNKRKGDDGHTSQAKSKRSRYISIAWWVLNRMYRRMC